jgi:AraC-like DNA-binding protein
MELNFCAPAPALADHVSVYYLMEHTAPRFEDIERADVGYLRFFITADGYYDLPNGERRASADVMLLGPWTATCNWVMHGEMISFGCVLLPEFWGGLADCEASSLVNLAVDGRDVFGDSIQELHAALSKAGDIFEMGRLVDAWLIRRIKPISADHRAVIHAIGDWLRQKPIPSPDRLYERTDMSPRQVMRISNRYFGAPPSVLIRKFRALRTASRLLGVRGKIPLELIDEYADQAHMTREVKAFAGRTPRQLQLNTDPVLHATLHPSNFREEAPWM